MDLNEKTVATITGMSQRGYKLLVEIFVTLYFIMLTLKGIQWPHLSYFLVN